MTINYFTHDAQSEDMIDSFLTYIAANFGQRPSVNEGERAELDYLRQTVARMQEEVYGQKRNMSPGRSTSESDKGLSSASDSGDDELVADLPLQVAAKNRGPRMSVSAEVFGKFNRKEDYVPPVHPKTEEQIAAIKSRIEGNFMFDSLNPVDTKAIIDAIVPTQWKAGDMIIRQGDDGDNFYVVENGTLTCTKQFNPGEDEKFLKEYTPGESFGELALLYNAPRAATIVANTGDVQLWSLDRNTFNNIIKTAVQKKREKYDHFLD